MSTPKPQHYTVKVFIYWPGDLSVNNRSSVILRWNDLPLTQEAKSSSSFSRMCIPKKQNIETLNSLTANSNPRWRSAQHLLMILKSLIWKMPDSVFYISAFFPRVRNPSPPVVYLTSREHPQMKASSSSPSAEMLRCRHRGVAQGNSNRGAAPARPCSQRTFYLVQKHLSPQPAKQVCAQNDKAS